MTVPSAVVFDLDGTLANSWSAHLRCLRHACVAVGQPAPSAAAVAQGQRATDLGTLAGLVGPANTVTALDAYHGALVNEAARSTIAPMCYALAVVERISRAGIPTAVCTGRSRFGALTILAAIGVEVAHIVAREDAPRPKPAPDGLRRAVKLAGGVPETAVYIGDTDDDRRQGSAAGVSTILVRATQGSAGLTVGTLAHVLPHLGLGTLHECGPSTDRRLGSGARAM